MVDNSLRSLNAYSQFVAEAQDRPFVENSTLTIWSTSPYTAVAEGQVFFINGFHLRMREEISFARQRITSYGYEVYRDAERLYWYDDFPHPNDPTLASTHPHHKHVPPNIKQNRIPAPGLSFSQPNLLQIIQEIEALVAESKS